MKLTQVLWDLIRHETYLRHQTYLSFMGSHTTWNLLKFYVIPYDMKLNQVLWDPIRHEPYDMKLKFYGIPYMKLKFYGTPFDMKLTYIKLT
jgi:hypothetical protein